MAVTVVHAFVSAIPDGADATVVRPSNWNEGHSVTGLAAVAESGAYADLTGTPTVSSSVYGPVRSAEANLSPNVSAFQAHWSRVNTEVSVGGRFTADPILTATATVFELSLPIASNIGAVEDLSGVAFCGKISGMGAEIFGSVANNTAVINWIASDITSQDWSYIYKYRVY